MSVYCMQAVPLEVRTWSQITWDWVIVGKL